MLLTACVLIPLSVGRRSRNDRHYALAMAWVGFFSIGFFSSLFIATLLRDVFLLGARVVSTAQQAAALATPSARWVLILTLFSSVVGLVLARRPRLVEVDIPIADLPRALQGFSIAQISDLHVGPTIKRAFVQRIVARVNVLKADLIAITGDLVDGSVSDLSQHTAPLAGLEARHGVYFVTGNHEYYSGERAWTAELRRLGLTVLKNEHVVLQHDGAPLLLAGVTDFSAHHFDPAQRSDPAAALLGSVAGSESENIAGTPAEYRDCCGGRGLRRAALGTHARRAVLAVEFTRGLFPTVYRRPQSAEETHGVCEPRDRLLGTAESLRCSRRNHAFTAGLGIAPARGHREIVAVHDGWWRANQSQPPKSPSLTRTEPMG